MNITSSVCRISAAHSGSGCCSRPPSAATALVPPAKPTALSARGSSPTEKPPRTSSSPSASSAPAPAPSEACEPQFASVALHSAREKRSRWLSGSEERSRTRAAEARKSAASTNKPTKHSVPLLTPPRDPRREAADGTGSIGAPPCR
eukprot:scaffold71790_cov29-Tisochrysis_lutea.AAC.7